MRCKSATLLKVECSSRGMRPLTVPTRGCLALADEAPASIAMLEADVAKKPIIPIVDDDRALLGEISR